jgi:hypothetical protein
MRLNRRQLRRLIESAIYEQESRMTHDGGGSTPSGTAGSDQVQDFKDSESRIGTKVKSKVNDLYNAMLPGLKDTGSFTGDLKSTFLPASFNVSYEKIKIIIHQIYKIILDDLMKHLGPKDQGQKLSKDESSRIDGAWITWVREINRSNGGPYSQLRKKSTGGRKAPSLGDDLVYLYGGDDDVTKGRELAAIHDEYEKPWISKTGYNPGGVRGLTSLVPGLGPTMRNKIKGKN